MPDNFGPIPTNNQSQPSLNLNGGNTISGLQSNNTFGPLGGNISSTINPQQQVPKTAVNTKKQAREAKRQEKEKSKYPKQKNVAKGFGKITALINGVIHDIREKVNDVYYGKKPVNPGSKSVNPLDYGLINVLNLLLEVDVCAIFSYGLNKLPGTPQFDPNDKKNASKTTLGKIKWETQNAAYEIKNTIDEYYTSYLDVNSQDSKIGLYSLLQNLNNKISSARELLYSEALLNSYPELNTINNYLDNAQKYYAKYTDINSINNNNVKDILSIIEKTKSTCSAILALNNPTAALQFVDTVFGTGLMEQIKKLDKVINPKNLPKAIKNLTDASKKVQDICNKITQYIDYARFIISIATLLIIVLKLINKFLKVLGVPNIFTFMGLNTTMSEANEKIVSGIDYFMNRLSEINSVLNSMYNLCKDLSLKIQTLIDGSKELLQNILDCQDSELPPLSNSVVDLNNSIKNLSIIKDRLDEFVNTYDKNKKKKDASFGNYTIEILTEQLTDEGIPRKRRYGVALDINRSIIVESTPTFASDDKIIIEEVKLKLISKKLVDTATASSVTSIEEMQIMEEALSYLPNGDVSLDDLDQNLSFDPISDDPDNEDEDDDEAGTDALNINAFVTKLKGGRKLRRRMRKKMAAQKLELANNLKKSDKSGKLSSSLVKKKSAEAIKDAIKAEQELIKMYQEAINKYKILLASNPASAVLYMRLIKNKQNQISEVEKKIDGLQKDLAAIK